jgi:hypothetical protein
MGNTSKDTHLLCLRHGENVLPLRQALLPLSFVGSLLQLRVDHDLEVGGDLGHRQLRRCGRRDRESGTESTQHRTQGTIVCRDRSSHSEDVITAGTSTATVNPYAVHKPCTALALLTQWFAAAHNTQAHMVLQPTEDHGQLDGELHHARALALLPHIHLCTTSHQRVITSSTKQQKQGRPQYSCTGYQNSPTRYRTTPQ